MTQRDIDKLNHARKGAQEDEELGLHDLRYEMNSEIRKEKIKENVEKLKENGYKEVDPQDYLKDLEFQVLTIKNFMKHCQKVRVLEKGEEKMIRIIYEKE